MTRLAQVFWGVTALDAALLLLALLVSLQDSGGARDGGREMGLVFFVLLPAGVLGLAALAFHFSGSIAVRAMALVVVLLPGLWWAKVQVDEVLTTRRMAANRAGTGFFDTEAMRRMGAAVMQHDVPTLMRLGPGVDVNTPGRDMTLLRLAAEALEPDGQELPVVRALLALGARADQAMPAAVARDDPALLEMLLAAGAHPNLQNAYGQPLIFDVKSSIPPRSFRLLAAHGLNLDSVSYGDPLPVQLAIYRRWDLLAIAIELGADTARTRDDGRSVAGELAAQADEALKAGRDVPAELQQARALLVATSRNRPEPTH